MRSFKRSERVADQILREAAGLVSDLVRDKAGVFVTVSKVEMTHDLRYARIYYTLLDDKPELVERVKAVLDNRTGQLQTAIAGRVRIRRAPEISFHYDVSLVKGMRVIQLIEEVTAKQDDEEDQTDDSDDA
ncbi:MAG: 30S ribosome-binding factor RbfA [candidate division Zixibacteria bacterium]|nr:30S ribosome-binding factor RbfA [candidate division Zixibacteria bacterium]